jgi:hypothetical protein
MASWTLRPSDLDHSDRELREPGIRAILAATGLAFAFILLTRWPVARNMPMDSDEFGFLGEVAVRWFPMHHTLFKTLARALGLFTGDLYFGFIALDMITSALALVTLWWWLRAVVPPATAAAGALVLGVGPDFWGYGAVASNYTAIVLVGSFLLGISIRGHRRPEPWHPFAAAAVLAAGTGYRSDIGLFWLPVFLMILWQHRWKPAILAGIGLVAMNLVWAGAMLAEVGGWNRYRQSTSDFAHNAGAMNSFWYLGFFDGPVRYAIKLGMALVWTLGPALLFLPRGIARLRRIESGGFLARLVVVSILPALATHLLLHFGVPGYCFHYLPTLMALIVVGIGRECPQREASQAIEQSSFGHRSVPRLLGIAAILTAVFLFYPTDFSAPGWRGDFDLAFCRLTRGGLSRPMPRPAPYVWRTANSRTTASPVETERMYEKPAERASSP